MPRTVVSACWGGVLPTLAFALSLAAAPCMAAAEEKLLTFEELITLPLEDLLKVKIVTASGRRQALDTAPATATVITAAQMAAMGATTVEEVLEGVAGVHVLRSSLLAYTPAVAIRGIFGDVTSPQLIMLNGVPINSLYHGGYNLLRGTPVNNLARIEIIRGPGSALYGADAFAGVINLITKTREDVEGLRVGTRRGTYNSGDAWLNYGTTWRDWDFALLFDYHDTEGHNGWVEADFQTALDARYGTQVSQTPGPLSTLERVLDARLDAAHGPWRLRLGYLQSRLGAGVGVAQALDPTAQYSVLRYNTDLSYHVPKFTEHWALSAVLSEVHTAALIERGLTLFPPGVTFPTGVFADGVIGRPEETERRSRLEVSGFYTGYAAHTLRVGGGADYSNLYEISEQKNFSFDTTLSLPVPLGGLIDATDTPAVFMPERGRRNLYAFVQDEWALTPKLDLTTGIRYDHYSDFGDSTNPRLALVWRPRPRWVTKLLYGHAFRAPNMAELYLRNNPVTTGNSDLKPEQLTMTELALNYQSPTHLQLNATIYTYHWTDIIRLARSQTAGTILEAANHGEQTGYGLELEAHWQATFHLRFTGNYAWQPIDTDSATNPDAGRAPRQHAYARARWNFMSGWSLTPQINWVADRRRDAKDPRADVRDIFTTDLILRQRAPLDRWNVGLILRNLFNRRVYEPSNGPNGAGVITLPGDLPGPGRTLAVEVGFKL